MNMKKTFFRFGVLLFVGLAATLFYSCEKEEIDDQLQKDLKIKAVNVVNGSDEIANVKLTAYDEDTYHIFAEAQYQNKGFTLELPDIIPDKYLLLIEEDIEEGITVSDITAKIMSFESIEAYDSDGEEIGEFYYMSDPSDESNWSITMWIYTNKKVTIRGDFTYNDEYGSDTIDYNLTLKKGWNIAYISQTETYNARTGQSIYTGAISNQKPSVAMKWYYESYYEDEVEEEAISLNSTKSVKSFFPKIKKMVR